MRRLIIKILLPLTLLFACFGVVACNRLPEKLSAPENLRVEGGILYWDKVEYADGYTLLFEEKEVETAECGYEIAGFSETKIYSFAIRAYSKGGLCSSFSDLTYVGLYAVPTAGIEYLLKNGSYTVTKYAVDSKGSCVIPSTYDGLPVTSVATTSLGVPNTSEDILKEIKNLYLPNSITDTNLTSYATFLPNLENIAIDEGQGVLVSEGNCIIDKTANTLKIGCINSTIPNYVTRIDDYAFEGRNITMFSVPEGIERVGIGVFRNCSQLKEVVFSDSFKGSLLDSTFRGCTSLVKAILPQSVTFLSSTFQNCTSLEEIAIPDNVTVLYVTFFGCTALKNIIVPESVRLIKGAFYGCTSLTDVVFKEGVESIVEYSLFDGPTFGAFENCISLSGIVLPSTIKRIGGYSFRNCVKLKSIRLSDGIVFLNQGAFENCVLLEEITLPESLEGAIGHHAFAGCSLLKTIEIPKGVTQLTGYNFQNCVSLKSIVLPKNIRMSFTVFENCLLEEVYYKGSETDWEENKSKIYEGNTELFAATWYYYSETAPTEEGNYWRYVNGVPTKWNTAT